MIETAAHNLSIERHVRELPSPDAWARYESTNNARVACTCGLDTDWLPLDKAKQAFIEHRDANPA